LQALLNPPAPEKAERTFNERVIREGDRVMQTKNNYEIEWEKNGIEGRGVFNGDIGTVISIDFEEASMKISFDERVCDYDFAWTEDLDHAYAITVHKSQGSEYGAVIVPLYRCAPMLLTRNLLYTAITRAEKMVILVGSDEVLRRMVETVRRTERRTALADRLREASGEY
jgi:exodeoxyribonuclease V alpha subunit